MRHLDTSIVSALMKQVRAAQLQMTRHYPRVAISAIVLAETRFGIVNSGRVAENTERLEELLQHIEVVPFDEGCALTYARIRKALKDKGCPVPDADLFIAATALTHNATLVTPNTRHFGNIEGLELEDWLA